MMEPATQKCERCGRRVIDGSVDFGVDGGFVLRPTCSGIAVVIGGEVRGYVSEDELRYFMERAYGA